MLSCTGAIWRNVGAGASAGGGRLGVATTDGAHSPTLRAERWPESASESWLEVTARDPDGVISEVTLEWTGPDYHSVVFANRSRRLAPTAPGDAVTMRIPVSLPGPGIYRARVHEDSGPPRSAQLGADGKASLTLDLPDTGPAIVRISHRSMDGVLAISELGPSAIP